MWDACGKRLGINVAFPGADRGIELASTSNKAWPSTPLLAARMRERQAEHDGVAVEAALLYRRQDTYCVTIMLEPPRDRAQDWAGLDAAWEAALPECTRSSLIGEVRLYLARLAAPGVPEPVAELCEAVKEGAQKILSDGSVEWWHNGVATPQGFVIWEIAPPPASSNETARAHRIDNDKGARRRRIIVVAPDDRDDELSGWTWVGDHQDLPWLGRYLWHAARVHDHHQTWVEQIPGIRSTRMQADDVMRDALSFMTGRRGSDGSDGSAECPRPEQRLAEVSTTLTDLRSGSVGLTQSAALLSEMRRTVEIAAANIAKLHEVAGGVPAGTGGLFEADRELAAWFPQQLDDDLEYQNATERRANQVVAHLHQLLQQRLQQQQEELRDRQERFNLALTGVIGAVLMVLTAIQALQYPVDVPPMVKLGVIATLGALALLASLVLLRVKVQKGTWPTWLVGTGVGLTAACAAWVVVLAVLGAAGTAAITWGWSTAAFGVGVAGSAVVTSLLRRRKAGQAPV